MSALSVVLFLAAVSCPGGAIRCYTCSSDKEPHCADPMDRSKMQPTECTMDSVQRDIDSIATALQGVSDRIGTQLFPHGDTTLEVPMVCQKIDLVGVNGRNLTARMCSLKDLQHGDLCQDFENKISRQKVAFCGVCEQDACNGAPRPRRPWLSGVLTLIPAAMAAALHARG